MKTFWSRVGWTLSLTKIAVCVLGCVCPTHAFALKKEGFSQEKAKELVKNFSDKTIQLLENKGKDVAKFELILKEFFNLPAIARHIMSVAWKSASDQEKKDYVEAFTHHIAKTYYSILEENYGGQEVEVLEVEGKGADSFMVACEVKSPKGHKVSFKVRIQKGKILDMIVENVSTANGLKNQYKEMYREVGKDFGKLIEKIRQKG